MLLKEMQDKSGGDARYAAALRYASAQPPGSCQHATWCFGALADAWKSHRLVRASHSFRQLRFLAYAHVCSAEENRWAPKALALLHGHSAVSGILPRIRPQSPASKCGDV